MRMDKNRRGWDMSINEPIRARFDANRKQRQELEVIGEENKRDGKEKRRLEWIWKGKEK